MAADERGGGERAGARTQLPIRATFRRVGEVYARRLRFLLAIGALIGIPIGLLDALAIEVDRVDVDSAARAIGAGAGAVSGFALSLFAGQLYAGLIGEAAVEVRRGHERPPIGMLVTELPYSRMIAANFLYVTGTAVGLLLLAIPGIVFFAWFAPAVALITLERGTVWESFARSRDLVRGSFWRVLLIVGAAYLLVSFLSSALQAAELWALGDSFLGDWVAAASVAALVTPIAAVTTVIITLELIELRDEGEAPR